MSLLNLSLTKTESIDQYMKVVVYSAQQNEKELLAVANGKVHDLTLISNSLNQETKSFALGKDVIVVSEKDLLTADMLNSLAEMGISKILTRTLHTEHIDLQTAHQLNLQVANTPYEDQSAQGIALQIVRNLNLWSSGKCVGTACRCFNNCGQKGDHHA